MVRQRRQGGKRIFVSFEYDRDHSTALNLTNTAKGRGYPAPIFDLSLRERYTAANSAWVPKARSMIQKCQLLVVILGQDTHNAPGVKREIQLAKELGKQIVQIRRKGTGWGPHSLLEDKPLIDWNWSEIDKYFDSNYGQH